MADRFIVSHDMGTSGDKAILVTVHGEIIGEAKAEYPIYHPHPGWAEQDPEDWWNSVCRNTRTILKKTGVKSRDVVGMTFSSQTQGLVPVDRNGMPLRRAIIWLDGRSSEIIREKLWTPPRLMGYNIFRMLRFLLISGGCPGHTGKDQIGKLLWLQRHEPDIFTKAYKFIDVKDYVIHKLTDHFVTSVDCAYIWWTIDSRKKRNCWHPGLLKYGSITPDRLSEIKESAAIIGRVTSDAAEQTGLEPDTPIINGSGDLSAAAIGSGAIDEGELHICVGTSGWVAGHYRKRKIDIPHYTGCIGSAYPEKYYLGMAHQETAGICLEWLKNRVLYHEEQLKKESHVSEVYEILDQLAETSPPGADGLMFTPWMYGERSPLDDDYVRAGLFNIGLNHSREHLVRAVFEGVAFNTRWAMETLEHLYWPVDQLSIIGGGAKGDIWCQIIADITNRVINRVAGPQHAGSRGLALLASMTLGFIDSYEQIKSYIRFDRSFHPNPENRTLYDSLFKEYKNLYKQNKQWYKRMNKERT